MAYQQHEQKSFCFRFLAYALEALKQFSAANSITTRIYSSIIGEILDRVMFSNAIMIEKEGKN